MKRMNVREFRAKIHEQTSEPVEVVRYSETVGFWVPIALTTEPPVKTARKIKTPYATTWKTAADVDAMKELGEKIAKMKKALDALETK